MSHYKGWRIEYMLKWSATKERTRLFDTTLQVLKARIDRIEAATS